MKQIVDTANETSYRAASHVLKTQIAISAREKAIADTFDRVDKLKELIHDMRIKNSR